ncbi:MAG: FAD:protein FMN transferase [Deltaproteobacteria bacterium]|nr:FAD:protein FMN transferase [Deltaproteobacteria bacterium]
MKRVLMIMMVLLLSCSVRADEAIREFVREFSVDGSSAAIILLGFERDAADVEKLIGLAVDYAKNLSSELRGGGKSDNVKAIGNAAKRVSTWTSGAYAATDIASLQDGFLADAILRYLYAGGMKNILVRINASFRGIGQSRQGPWTVQVQDEEGTFAHHALNLTVQNTGVATVTAGQYRGKTLIDPRTKQPVTLRAKGVVVVSREAALAQGVAQAIFLMGPQEGMTLFQKLPDIKGMIVDAEGNFLRSPGF